ncbi:MAG: hypothetical protein ACI959_002158, partial [Limisphaerales bacterium]
ETGNYAVEVTKNGCTDISACQSITVVVSTGIDDEFDDAIKLYPNPSFTELTIELGLLSNVLINIRDIKGKQVISTSTSMEKVTISTQSLSPGIYLVELMSSESKRVYKFVKN